ncbi:hypothetical protein EYF80_004420 [Liparis tanakae]|uniref:Uncharacterized protein n=1 Tax=Liparis tanakae TaxID=230148 RepID=A0A4Z2J6V5_9TELE|nr:hypothetical protein EYF80_004420 [Liparis tanakae]
MTKSVEDVKHEAPSVEDVTHEAPSFTPADSSNLKLSPPHRRAQLCQMVPGRLPNRTAASPAASYQSELPSSPEQLGLLVRWGHGAKAKSSETTEFNKLRTEVANESVEYVRHWFSCPVDILAATRGEKAPPRSNEAGDDLKSIAVAAQCNPRGAFSLQGSPEPTQTQNPQWELRREVKGSVPGPAALKLKVSQLYDTPGNRFYPQGPPPKSTCNESSSRNPSP